METQMQFTFKFMIVMITVASFSLPTAIALYWIVTNGFAIFQNLLFKKINQKKSKR
jgi:membrane protein insertase Oxa1/YidC/SpoIIIJ